jgi:ribosomal protein S2
MNRKQLIMQKLINTRAHLGFRTAYSDFQPYLYGFRNEMAIINLDITLTCLRRACNAIDLIMQSKGHLLIVNTNMEYNKLVCQTAKQTNQSYINYKWIGGLLTNWSHMQNVQQHFQDFASKTQQLQLDVVEKLSWAEQKAAVGGETLLKKTRSSSGLEKLNCDSSQYSLGKQRLQLDNTSTEKYHAKNSSYWTAATPTLKQKKHESNFLGSKKQGSKKQGLKQSESNCKIGSSNTTHLPFVSLGSCSNDSSVVFFHKKKDTERDILIKKTQELHTTLHSFPRFKKMSKCFEGILAKELPDCILVMNATQNYNAINEAAKLQIPIIALVDSNIPNSLHHKITYSIPANHNSFKFIYLFCNCIIKTINASKNSH